MRWAFKGSPLVIGDCAFKKDRVAFFTLLFQFFDMSTHSDKHLCCDMYWSCQRFKSCHLPNLGPNPPDP